MEELRVDYLVLGSGIAGLRAAIGLARGGQVLVVTAEDIWQSQPDACTVVVNASETEDWSKIDFVKLDGVVDCPDPLQSLSGSSSPVTMTTLGFDGHLFATTLEFENL